MKKKMWHCKYCGNTQDASEPICRSCGNDLVIYGDIIFEEQGGVTQEQPVSPTYIADPWQNGNYGGVPPYQQGNNGGVSPYQQGNNGGVPPYQQGNNGGVPPYQQGNNGGIPPYQQGNNGGVSPYQQGNPYHQYGNNAGNGKSGGKKGIIALIAVFLVAAVSVATVFLLTGDKKKKDNTTEKYDYPSYSTTTTKPTTTAPTTTRPTTTKPAQKAYIPEFAYYAEDYVISYQINQKMSGKDFYSSTYILDSDLCYDVVADYMAFLMSGTYCIDFLSDEFFSDSASDVAVVGHYTGTADVDEITYESDGNEYSGELYIFMKNDESTGYTTVIMLYDDNFTVLETSERADIDIY